MKPLNTMTIGEILDLRGIDLIKYVATELGYKAYLYVDREPSDEISCEFYLPSEANTDGPFVSVEEAFDKGFVDGYPEIDFLGSLDKAWGLGNEFEWKFNEDHGKLYVEIKYNIRNIYFLEYFSEFKSKKAAYCVARCVAWLAIRSLEPGE